MSLAFAHSVVNDRNVFLAETEISRNRNYSNVQAETETEISASVQPKPKPKPKFLLFQKKFARTEVFNRFLLTKSDICDKMTGFM